MNAGAPGSVSVPVVWQSELPDYSRFMFCSTVDWIEVRLRVALPSQPRHIRRRMAEAVPHWGNNFVRAETEDPSRTATSFTFRVQNPAGPEQFMREVQCVAPGDSSIAESDIEIIGIEVALDAYSRAQDRNELVNMVHHFFRKHARPPEGVARITEAGRYRGAFGPRETLAALAEEVTINGGEQNGPHCSRYYLKNYDSLPDEMYATLPSAQWRARMEVTLRGEHLPFRRIEDWRKFKFQTLAKRFSLRESTQPSNQLGVEVQRRITRHGKADDQAKRSQHRRLHQVNTRADTIANKLIHVALAKLTGYQAGKRPRGLCAQK